MPFALKLTDIDGETSHGFFWPLRAGEIVEASGPFTRNGNPCPSRSGDGLCLGTTWAGLQSGGQTARCLSIVRYDDEDVLAFSESQGKLRVIRCEILVPSIDVHKAVRRGEFDDLSGANLSGANLRNANLHGADLSGADLYGANLSGARNLEYARNVPEGMLR